MGPSNDWRLTLAARDEYNFGPTVLARLAHSLVGFYRGLRLAIIIARVPRDRKYHYQRSPHCNSRITLPSSFAHQQTKIHCLFPFLIWDPFTQVTASHPPRSLLFMVWWLVFYLLPHRAPIILNIILMRAAIVYLIVISLLIDLRPLCTYPRRGVRTDEHQAVRSFVGGLPSRFWFASPNATSGSYYSCECFWCGIDS